MPRGKIKRPKAEAVKAAADRAEAASRGEEIPPKVTPLDPPTATISAPPKLGRPSDYRPEFPLQAQKLYSAGFTDVEVADFFETSINTLYRWASRNPEFREAMSLGKAPADDRVERALFHRAIGYTYERTKYVKVDGGTIPVVVKEHLPPDTQAAMHWLKNRRPDKWRDVHQIEHGRPGEFQQMSDQELRQHVLEETKALAYLIAPDDENKTQH